MSVLIAIGSSLFLHIEMDQQRKIIENKKFYTKEEITKLIKSDSPSIILSSPTKTQRSSKSWSSYKLVSIDNVPQNFAMCVACKTLVTFKNSTGTGGLQKHIDSCTSQTTITNNQTTLDSLLVPITSDSFFSSKDVQQQRNSSLPKTLRRSLNLAFVEFVALDCRSFETIRGRGFTRLIHQVFKAGQSSRTNINTNILIPSTKTVCFFSHICFYPLHIFR